MQRITNVALKLEAVVIPVSDVDRAKGFYGNLGWRLDADSFPMTPVEWPHFPSTSPALVSNRLLK
jgi:catechol 2,3-dioxygenase-like lactoylglutathione lyase family enzyme